MQDRQLWWPPTFFLAPHWPPLFKFLNRHRASAQHFSHQGYTKVHYLSSPAEHSNLDLDKKKLFHICPLTRKSYFIQGNSTKSILLNIFVPLHLQTRRYSLNLKLYMFRTRCAKCKPDQKNEDRQDKQQNNIYFRKKVQKRF